VLGYGGDGFKTTSGCSIGDGYTSGGQAGGGTFTIDRRLTMWIAQSTVANKNVVVQFTVRNPIKKQASPTIYIEGQIGGDKISSNQWIQDSILEAGATSEATTTNTGGSFCSHRRYGVAMDKDSTSVLCCASCSFATGAVAGVASATAQRTANAPDGQMTLQGDAEPLKVHTPFFCIKDIGQSSPYPCDNNTLTVTFTSNTFLKAGVSKVTISGIEGAIADPGVIPIADGPYGLGHNNYFGGEFEGSFSSLLATAFGVSLAESASSNFL
jgi:hypothetical protein